MVQNVVGSWLSMQPFHGCTENPIQAAAATQCDQPPIYLQWRSIVTLLLVIPKPDRVHSTGRHSGRQGVVLILAMAWPPSPVRCLLKTGVVWGLSPETQDTSLNLS
ncbi:hypothetical protein VFPPC_16761 [Pochonia chlamydosporia 170]|uniref:Uncharacterized protein n=1 Tax=Pochonia chlamydosporia 170 TaxID=1380566 RepID=A0A179F5K7_METCM|nr:hypothetical protein VFPPC_16761 [Pochonia chlamydosporia 170]OAQ60717.1 hypothetical protein VFPPC_16761 [Pochonia chlamydosporia 170]